MLPGAAPTETISRWPAAKAIRESAPRRACAMKRPFRDQRRVAVQQFQREGAGLVAEANVQRNTAFPCRAESGTARTRTMQFSPSLSLGWHGHGRRPSRYRCAWSLPAASRRPPCSGRRSPRGPHRIRPRSPNLRTQMRVRRRRAAIWSAAIHRRFFGGTTPIIMFTALTEPIESCLKAAKRLKAGDESPHSKSRLSRIRATAYEPPAARAAGPIFLQHGLR